MLGTRTETSCSACGGGGPENSYSKGLGRSGFGQDQAQSGDTDDVVVTELQWRDIFVIVPDPSRAHPLVRGLRQAAVPVAVVDQRTATARDWEDLTLARTDRVTVTDYDCVRGLERQVVVGVGESVGQTAGHVSEYWSAGLGGYTI